MNLLTTNRLQGDFVNNVHLSANTDKRNEVDLEVTIRNKR